MHYINIHTHKDFKQKFTVQNLFPEETDQIKATGYYSVGIHPWEVQNTNIDKSLSIVHEAASLQNVLAIGEIGLDKFKDAFNLQTHVFLKQVDIAVTSKKPIIIHCVKAYSELLSILKEKQLSIPVIIHRYSGNKTIADQLIKFGSYLSFGHELFNERSKVQKVFRTLPDENIFLETDDSDISLEDIYEKAADLRNISIEKLQKIIIANFRNCFQIEVNQ